MDQNWDMTLQKIIPFIDGLKSVKKISALADVDFTLTKRCMEHLRSYGCLFLVDVFQFNNVYALTPDIEDIVASPDLQDECVRYVSSGSTATPPFATLFELYCSLRQGKMLRQWIPEHSKSLGGIDVRRFISFGVIKGFLYRVHRYPTYVDPANGDKKLSERKRPLLRHLDGRKHMDALCTMLDSSVRDVEDQLAEIENVQWVWK